MLSPTSEDALATEPHWYCLRSQPKHEHIAAAHLRQTPGLEVFCPRVRIQRRTQRGLKWFVEAMFPNYLFARFALREHQTMVRYSPGVSGIVHFGQHIAPVRAELRLNQFLRDSVYTNFKVNAETVFRTDINIDKIITQNTGLMRVFCA